MIVANKSGIVDIQTEIVIAVSLAPACLIIAAGVILAIRRRAVSYSIQNAEAGQLGGRTEEL